MTMPKLPEPHLYVVGSGGLYTAEQMREYGQIYAEKFMSDVDSSRMRNNASGQVSPNEKGLTP
jgi:hypothetical protein